MALNDILIKIKEETEEKSKKIKEETELKLQEIDKEWQKKIAEEKERILQQAKQTIDKKNKQQEIKIALATKNFILTEKQKTLDNLWQEAIEELSQIDDDKYLQLIVDLLTKCPAEKGVIIVAQGREKSTQEAIKKSHRQDVLSSGMVKAKGGFIYFSDSVEINFTFEELIKEMRDEVNLGLTKILFS